MKLSRRSLFLASLGVSQLALLDRFGLGGVARATTPGKGPTKLLTIYVPGGWMPTFLWCPFTKAQISKHITALAGGAGKGEPGYFSADQVITPRDGQSSFDPAPGAVSQPIRIPRQWDPSNPAAGGRNTGFTPHGYSWVKNQLWQNMCVVHGVDQGTAAHESAMVSAMCGAAGSEYRAPAMHAVVADALYDKYRDARILPCVSIGAGPYPNRLELPGRSAAMLLQGTDSLRTFVSDKNDVAWGGLRDRQKTPRVAFDGTANGTTLDTTATDDYVLAATRGLRGKSSAGTDAFLQNIYEGYAGVSTLVARDVVTLLEKTPSIDPAGWYVDLGGGNATEGGSAWVPQLDLAMRLLRSDVTSAISIECRGPGGFFFDTHGDTFGDHLAMLRGVNEAIGRFLGVMKNTPGTSGGTLLDETLVVIFSEFSRGFGNNDHWPHTSVVFAGGGVTPDLMVGNYDMEPKSAGESAAGLPVDLVDETGTHIKRPPKSADIVTTALKILGVDKFFIPGGYGEIQGVRAA